MAVAGVADATKVPNVCEPVKRDKNWMILAQRNVL